MPRREPQNGHTSNGAPNQAVVHIHVADGGIESFPQREGDTLIFNCWDPVHHPPGPRPIEVRWLVTGLQEDQFVRIQPKAASRAGVFPKLSYLDVACGFDSATSGEPALRAGAGQRLAWAYDILLCEGTAKAFQVLKTLDPGVIIKDYP